MIFIHYIRMITENLLLNLQTISQVSRHFSISTWSNFYCTVNIILRQESRLDTRPWDCSLPIELHSIWKSNIFFLYFLNTSTTIVLSKRNLCVRTFRLKIVRVLIDERCLLLFIGRWMDDESFFRRFEHEIYFLLYVKYFLSFGRPAEMPKTKLFDR